MKYLTCAETAKLIRKALKEAFPDIKFSVRSKTYSGGASIDISWTDGPNERQVNAIAHTFQGSYFDGQIDYKGNLSHMIDGEQVSFGANFVFCHREYSDAAKQRAIDSVYRKYQGNFEHDGIAKPELEAFNTGKLWNVQLSNLHVYGNQSVQSEIHAALAKHSDRLAVGKSATAEKVVYLGSDGHGQNGSVSGDI